MRISKERVLQFIFRGKEPGIKPVYLFYIVSFAIILSVCLAFVYNYKQTADSSAPSDGLSRENAEYLAGMAASSADSSAPDDVPGILISGDVVFQQKDESYLVYFYKPECKYCKLFKPTLEKYVAQENALPLYKVDLSSQEEKDRGTKEKYQIQGTPTVIYVKNSVEVARWLGSDTALEDLPVS